MCKISFIVRSTYPNHVFRVRQHAGAERQERWISHGCVQLQETCREMRSQRGTTIYQHQE